MLERESFGGWLKRQRKARALTQAELANRVGCAVITLRKIEADALHPSYQITSRLIEELGITTTDRSNLIAAARDDSFRHQHNLPTPLTAVIGREVEIAAVCALLRGSTRLLTLAGPGGIGKTRLAIQIATTLLDDFADGCAFVDLAPIRDPDLVLPTIAQVLRVRERPNRPLLDLLTSTLRSKRILLVLDNFEQVVGSALQMGTLLAAVPGLKIIVTSQAILHISGEHVFTVPPLALPTLQDLRAPEGELLSQLAHVPAVMLFVERARAAAPQFALTVGNARAVGAICTRLDGLPLAIELAAARCRLFAPADLLARLEQRLSLLTNGAQDLPARQQTLRATIDWSYGLLDAANRTLLRRLAIFQGGCTLEAADSVLHIEVSELAYALQPAPPLVDGVTALLDHSLLMQQTDSDGLSRFMMFETVREYVLEHLLASGELPELRARHSAYYLVFAEAAEPQLEGAEQSAWLHRLDAEHDNMRAVLAANLAPDGDPALALRLSSALWLFWWIRGYWSQGRTWLAAALAVTPPAPTLTRAQALHGAGFLARYMGDLPAATQLLTDALTMYRDLEDLRGIAYVLVHLGILARDRGDYLQAQSYSSEALVLARSARETTICAWALQQLGDIALWSRNYSAAEHYYAESLAMFRELGGQIGIAAALRNLANIALEQHHYAQGLTFAEESLALGRTLGDLYGIAFTLRVLGSIAHAIGDAAGARARCEESAALLREIDEPWEIGYVQLLEGQIAEGHGDTASARTCYDASRRKFEQAGNRDGLGQAIYRLSSVAITDGDPQTAYHLLEIYVALMEEMGQARLVALGTCKCAAALALLDEPRAIALLEHARARYHSTDDRWSEAVAVCVLSVTLIRTGADEQALDCIQDGLELASKVDAPLSLLTNLIGLAALALRRAETAAAAQLCGAVAALTERLGVGYVTTTLWPPDRALDAATQAVVQSHQNEAAVAAAWAAGRVLDTAEAIAMAQALAAMLSASFSPTAASHATITAGAAEPTAQDLEAFAYSVAHDLRAPLRAISGYTNSLQEDYESILDAEAQQMIATIHSETGRMGRLIDDLLAFARLGYTNMRTETIDMNQLVSEVFAEMMREENKTRIRFQVDALPPAAGDPNLMRQVWVNLLANAVKYSSKRPRAIITVQGTQVHDICTYQVYDNGAGFEMQYAHKLFGVFQRLHSEQEFPGTGVGLAIVQRILSRHGGRIWAESILDQGTTFSFTLPVQPAG